MESGLKKKLGVILLSFFVIMIPLSYYLLQSYAVDIQTQVARDVLMNKTSDNDKIDDALESLDFAIMIKPNSYIIQNTKTMILIEYKRYEEALLSARECVKINGYELEGYMSQGIIYENLNEFDSSIVYYNLAIEKLKNRVKNKPDDLFQKRSLSLLLKIVGKDKEADSYLHEYFSPKDNPQNKMLSRLDFYIEAYQGGGMINYTEGKTVGLKYDGKKSQYEIDSISFNNRIYYSGYSTENHQDSSINTYDFLEIFKDKALEVGFIE